MATQDFVEMRRLLRGLVDTCCLDSLGSMAIYLLRAGGCTNLGTGYQHASLVGTKLRQTSVQCVGSGQLGPQLEIKFRLGSYHVVVHKYICMRRDNRASC